MLCLEIENVSICDEQCLPQTEKVDLKKKTNTFFLLPTVASNSSYEIIHDKYEHTHVQRTSTMHMSTQMSICTRPFVWQKAESCAIAVPAEMYSSLLTS